MTKNVEIEVTVLLGEKSDQCVHDNWRGAERCQAIAVFDVDGDRVCPEHVAVQMTAFAFDIQTMRHDQPNYKWRKRVTTA